MALLLGGSALLFFPQLGNAPLERAEIYFMDGARAMVESGDYVVPRYRGEPFFDKPPLAYWLMAAAYGAQGFSPRSARLVPAVSAAGAVLATVMLGTLLVGRRAALAGGLALATTLAFLSFARIAMSDMLLTFWSTLAMACAVAAVRPSAAPSWVAATGFVLGMGFLTKGPVAVLLPGLGMLALGWRARRAGTLPRRGPLLLGAAIAAVVGLAWFLAVYSRMGWGPLAYFFLRENLQRFAAETYDTGRAPWYYLGTYLAEGLPWSAFLPLAAWRAWRRRGEEAAPASGARLLLVWFGLMLAPLSLSRGKLDYYLLPLYPAGALAIGWLLMEVPWRRAERVWARSVLVALGLALLAIPILPVRIPRPWLPAEPLRSGLLAALTLAGAGLLVVAARVTRRRLVAGLAAATALAFLVATAVVLPHFRGRQPTFQIVRDVARELKTEPDARLAHCEDPARVQRDVLFYTRLVSEEHCSLWAPAVSRLPYLLLVRRDDTASLGRVPGVRVVGEYRYVPATALTLQGLFRRYDADELVLLANFPTEDPVSIRRAKRAWKRSLRMRRAAEEKRLREVEASPPGSPEPRPPRRP